jgi:tripartite ATP-independent transporter DctM subunit
MGVLALVLFFVLLALSVPIGFSFAIVGAIYIILFRGIDSALYTLGNLPYQWATAQTLIAMPLFILMGYFAFHSGISKDLYDAGYHWFGRLPGGMAMGTTVANAGFAACCGAPMASAATMGAIAYPEMKKLNYDDGLSTGSIAAGATIAAMIPPSIPFILYGMLAGTSINELFTAGIIPGLLMTFSFMAYIYIKCKINPEYGPTGPRFTMKEKMKSLGGIWPMLLLFLVVIGGLYVGIFTATEAGAVGAFGAFVIGVAKTRLTIPKIIAAAKETGKIVSFIFSIVIGSQVFNVALGVVGFSQAFSGWVSTLPVSPYIILLFIIVLYLVLGMILDIMAIIMLTIPVLAPIMTGLGFDPIWFGVIVVMLAMIGFITPPFGMNLFVVQGVTKVKIQAIFKGVIPFAIATMVCILLVIIFPQLALYLPSLAAK